MSKLSEQEVQLQALLERYPEVDYSIIGNAKRTQLTIHRYMKRIYCDVSASPESAMKELIHQLELLQ